MTIKQGFQLLNPFSLGCQNQTMFSGRQSDKVNEAIIASNAIQMVDMPAFRQYFIMVPFPNNPMFCNIFIITNPNHNITSFYMTATLPKLTTRALHPLGVKLAHTLLASLGLGRHRLTAHWAGLFLVLMIIRMIFLLHNCSSLVHSKIIPQTPMVCQV